MQKRDCSVHVPTNWSPDIFELIQWKENDVVISGSAKQGTTWMQNILHQVRTGGDASFKNINDVCPRPEIVQSPGQSDEERWSGWENGVFKKYPFRILKTHVSPPRLPLRDEVKYIIPVRNGKDAVVSLYKYRNNMTDDFKRVWGGESFPSFDVCFQCFLQQQDYWRMINSWLSHRHKDNVLMIHFSDLKRDPEGNIEKIARFLGCFPDQHQWTNIIKYCSFPWMKAHSTSFEASDMGLKAMKEGTMIRKGEVSSNQNYFTQKHHDQWRELHEQLLPDEKIRRWCDDGGILPL